ncbi:MAG TPA: alpha/beta hydrolase, partial [Myxococcota bacterium]|nr:alpha/beta hydrolase [Myxococcota bacterium]
MILLLLTMCLPPKLHDLPEQGEQADHLLVLVHGAGDGPEDWPTEWKEELPDCMAEPERWDIWTYDWSEDAKRKSSAAGRAYKHGISLGDQISEDYDYAYVHLVGHSAGAFVVQGAIEQLIGP